MEQYHINSKIGEGTYAEVFEAIDISSGEAFALKKF
jgi:serine/threonine protein kinase